MAGSNFVDYVKIFARSGHGGAGSAHFRREKFVAFGGDGGTYDIGLQSLSGALERGHDFTYICYNNQGYMNTGAQRSSATPQSANATTSPAGSAAPGKLQRAKDLTEIVAAHNIPYVAQTSLHNPLDLVAKVKRAVETEGPAFVNVLVPCPLFWKIDPANQADICRMAVDSNIDAVDSRIREELDRYLLRHASYYWTRGIDKSPLGWADSYFGVKCYEARTPGTGGSLGAYTSAAQALESMWFVERYK